MRFLFRSLAHFLTGLFSYCWHLRFLCTFWITVLYVMCILQIFSSSVWLVFSFSLFKKFKNFFDFRRKERERETLICCSTYWCIYLLILLCTLTGDWTHNFGVSGRHSNQPSYPARAVFVFLILVFVKILFLRSHVYMYTHIYIYVCVCVYIYFFF